MDFSKIKKAYLIGIKGTGMSAMAEILVKRGIIVSGSDTNEKFLTEEVLKNNQIHYFENFSADHIEDDDLFVHSTSYTKENNTEVAEVLKRKRSLLSYPELLGILFSEKVGIAVCGTHGKTTTTAMLAQVLKYCGKDPSAIVGSQVVDWQSSMLSGEGEYFVAEADEYQNKLKYYKPWSVILTSADWDHPDYFPTHEEYKDVFKKFVSKIPKTGHLVIWGDSSDTIEISKSSTSYISKYGLGDDNDYIIKNYKSFSYDENDVAQTFELYFKEEFLGLFSLNLLGKHNALNAGAVISICHQMGIDMTKVANALREFKGTSRRFEILGEYKGAILIDDYGHHPDEILVTLKGARERYPKKNIWSVFHPHTYSRTRAFLQEFSQSFGDADKVIVLDIYASAREEAGNVSSKDLVRLINKYTLGKAIHIPTIEETVDHLAEIIGKDDVVILIGAGNAWEIGKKLLEK